MPVITTDVLLEGIRRDDVLAWLSEPKNHERLLDGAFDALTVKGPGEYEVRIDGVPPRARTMGYSFERVDEEHGGRRVHVLTTGKRTAGKVHYSLRTMKPSTNTLVTLHYDYEAGGPLGQLVEALGLRGKLESSWRKVLENLQKTIQPSKG